ncbi:unnamed protein product, partial [Aureobasidium mustum]
MEARGDMTFFLSYDFGLGQGARFTCQLYNKSRITDPRGGDTSIDRCEVSVEDKPNKVQCRLVVRMILKQPLETAISLHIQDFDDFHAEEDIHIVINVKDFKAIVVHAETLKAPMSAQFSRPGRPLLFRYTDKGLTCEFILMTTGISQAVPPATAPKVASTRPVSQASRQPSAVPLRPSGQSTVDPDASTRQPSVASGMPSRQTSHAVVQTFEDRNTEMAPPPKPAPAAGLRERRVLGSLGRQISQATTTSNADPDPESLFMPQGDEDDSRFDPTNFDEEPEEMLGWDANADVTGGFHPTFRDAITHEPPPLSQSLNRSTQGLPPTQRLSQVRSLLLCLIL